MTVTPQSPILGPTPPGATVAAAMAYVAARTDRGQVIRPADVATYVTELFRLCLLAGIRFEIAFAQACDECDVFRDPDFWGKYGNPVGYGAEETLEHPGEINYTGGRWTPVGAARVHLVHLWLYAAGPVLPSALADFRELDVRWTKALPEAGNSPTLGGLSGRWAANPNYAVQIAAHANRAFKEAPMATRGHVPKPPMMERYSARINAIGGVNCTDGIPRVIVGTNHHTEVGYFTTTADYFDDPANGALTDFQIGGKWDGQFNGVIMRFIEPDMPVAPYANGKIGEVKPPYGDGLRFVQTFGYGEAINAKLRSIEWSDGAKPNRTDYLVTDPQVESDCFLTAYVHSEEAGQGWEEFDWYLFHGESGTSHVDCPGRWRWDNVDALRARSVEIMRAYQENIPLSRPLLITYPPGWAGPRVAQPGTIPGDTPAPTPVPPPKPVPPPWAFDPKIVWKGVGSGPVSRAYIAYGQKTGLWGEPSQPWNDRQADGSKLYRFDNGLILRVLKDGKTVETVTKVA